MDHKLIMKNFILLFITLLLPVVGFSQGKEASIWYFGRNAGLSFAYGDPFVVTNGALITNEGCASICNSQGHLLFYTDGVNVLNRKHKRMPYGFGLKGHSSASQSAIIIPKPGSRTEYYIFTVDSRETGLTEGLCYSKVDLTLNNGFGDVVPSEKNIQLVANTCEKVTAVVHSDGESFWVITKKFGNADFYAFRVSIHGVELNPVISTSGPPVTIMNDAAGCLKVSHDGKWLVSANLNMGIDFHRFDNSTGKVTHIATESTDAGVFGVEFSPDNHLVYISEIEYDEPDIYQYDLSSGNPTAILYSRFNLHQDLDHNFPPGELQLGPDNRIYIALVNGDHLARINKPDLRGDRCEIEPDVCNLNGKFSAAGLPQFIQSYFSPVAFNTSPNCISRTTFFSIENPAGIDSVKWEFNDAGIHPYDTSTLLNPSYHFSHPGTFYVKLTAWSETGVRSTTDTVIIRRWPTAGFPHDTIPYIQSYHLEATPGYGHYKWNTGENINYINVTSEGEYTVTMQSADGCRSTDTVYMLEASVFMKVPNAFTPNGDGLNDTFRPVANLEMVRQFRMTIYNKWGEKIFKTTDATAGWNGAGAMPGVYVWAISYENRVGQRFELKGSVTVIK